jgi:putative ABC transport system permease protein
MIKKIVRFLMGDSCSNYRIVGTNADYRGSTARKRPQGRLWQRPMEPARRHGGPQRGLTPGDTLSGAHGRRREAESSPPRTRWWGSEAHGHRRPAHPLTDFASVWFVHEHGWTRQEPGAGDDSAHAGEAGPAETANHAGEAAPDSTTLANREVTALLVQYRTPAAAAMLPRNINKTTNMMAASPAFELARLINLVGVGLDVVRAFGFVFILIAALSMFVGLYNALEARRFDLAILRTLGATRGQVFRTILVEGLVVAALGTALGLLLGHGVTEALGAWLKQKNQLELTGFTWLPAEFGLLGLALLVGGLSALVPAWRAYRSDIAETLARAS